VKKKKKNSKVCEFSKTVSFTTAWTYLEAGRHSHLHSAMWGQKKERQEGGQRQREGAGAAKPQEKPAWRVVVENLQEHRCRLGPGTEGQIVQHWDTDNFARMSRETEGGQPW
jgi:hypothetical protein